MEKSFIVATLFNLGMNLLYTFAALIVGIVALKFIDRRLMKAVDIQHELKNNNIAVAIFASTILFFVALIISFGLKG